MKINKNIWIFNHYAITPALPGGTRHFDFAKELVKRGYKVSIFASSFLHGQFKVIREHSVNNFMVEEYDGIRFVWIKTFPYYRNDLRRIINMLSYSVRAYKVAKKINVEKPDIIIGSSVHLFAVFAAYLISKKYKVPFIMEVRDLWPQTLIDMGVPKWHPFVIILGFLEKFLYKKANKIIVLLPKANMYMENLGVSPDKIIWIPNGVDLRRFDKSNNQIENDKSSFIITYMGAIGMANNLDVIIEVAEILKESYKELKFLLVGEGPEKDRLAKIVKNKNLHNVEFKENIPKDKVSEILCNSDALFFHLKDTPVFNYGISSNKLFDYLASGKPIIFASNSINNPVEEAKAGITVPPNNPQAIAQAIIKLYKMSDEDRKEIGINGRKYVEKNHSIAILVDKLEKVIKECEV